MGKGWRELKYPSGYGKIKLLYQEGNFSSLLGCLSVPWCKSHQYLKLSSQNPCFIAGNETLIRTELSPSLFQRWVRQGVSFCDTDSTAGSFSRGFVSLPCRTAANNVLLPL